MEWLIVGLLAIVIGALGLLSRGVRGRFQHLDGRLDRLEARVLQSTKKDRAALTDAIQQSSSEVQNTVSLATMRFDFPVFFAGWSIDSFLGRHLVQHIMEHRPKVIVELGSGTSTLLIAKCCELLGYRPVHIAVDHEQRYLDLTRQSARLNGLEAGIVFLHCPLGAVQGFEQPWYVDLPARLGDVAIDLLVVDGPPGTTHSRARYPALPALRSMLSADCTVILDDASRADEQAIVKSWVDEHPEFESMLLSAGHGVAVISQKARA